MDLEQMDIVDLLKAAAPRVAERLWESPTRFWSILEFTRGRPTWNGQDSDFIGGLPRGGRIHGSASLSGNASWLRLHDLPPSTVPIYLVLGRGAGPDRGCLGYEELTQFFGTDAEWIDLRCKSAGVYQIAPLPDAKADLLADARRCWLLEMDQHDLGTADARRPE